ncbi:hypothetical protein B4U79_16855 [Dinothrombium tinctorium]|uniref:F-box domain-containing protein n=1 Tax=Dinothrombium tinctorium TaxID=1965070 RepID=A0A3S3RGI6_9ACAR|nr:hypothetical protein B4U79_16856 [Dinothrombium tinctorium]RWS00514.1 hypothetical protein B4U79_16855 [Dinothrombium tinctorium]
MESKESSFERLTDDVLMKIVSFVAFKDMPSLRCTSKRLNSICGQQLLSRSVLVNEGFFDFKQQCYLYENGIFNKEMKIRLTYAKMLNLLKKTLPNVRSLALVAVDGLFDENVHIIGEYLPNLQNLFIFEKNDHLKDSGLSRLFPKCPNLQRVWIHGIGLDGSCFKSLSKITYFSYMPYYNSFIETIDLTMLVSSLQTLRIHSKNHFSFPKHFLPHCDHLKSLSIPIFDETQFATILNNISVVGRVSKLGVAIHFQLESELLQTLLPNHAIKNLSFKFLSFVSTENIGELLQRFPNVEHLCLKLKRPGNHSRNEVVDINQLLSIISNVQRLQTLELCVRKEHNAKSLRINTLLSLLNIERLRDLQIGYLWAEEVNEIIACVQDYYSQRSDKRVKISLIIGDKATVFVPSANIAFNLIDRISRHGYYASQCALSVAISFV